MTARVAFLGTGLMGAPMTLRLLDAGFAVRVWNRSPGKLAPLVSHGAEAAETPAQAAAGAAFVCLCLTDGAAVGAVVEAAQAALERNAILIDFSTIGPEATRDLAARMAQTRPDVMWIDAPVSGGVRGAENGELVVMCGGGEAAVAAVAPVFAPLAKRVSHLGPLGAGQAAKLCNQLIVAANIAAIAEAMELARDQGLAIADLPHVLQGGWADSLPLQIIGPRMAAGQTEPVIVAIDTYVKDLGLVRASARRDLPLADTAAAVFGRAVDAGLGAVDVAALLGGVDKRAE